MYVLLETLENNKLRRVQRQAESFYIRQRSTRTTTSCRIVASLIYFLIRISALTPVLGHSTRRLRSLGQVPVFDSRGEENVTNLDGISSKGWTAGEKLSENAQETKEPKPLTLAITLATPGCVKGWTDGFPRHMPSLSPDFPTLRGSMAAMAHTKTRERAQQGPAASMHDRDHPSVHEPARDFHR